ncbi:FxsC protein [Streptomyces sp. NPDC008238]
MSRFYLSHIRGVDEEWTATLFRDLAGAVAARTGGSPESVGVSGTPRSPEATVERMRGATTMVALYAPGYFGHSYCATEWSYFEHRAEVLWSRTGRSADAIIPVVWAPATEPLPAVVRRKGPLTADSPAYARDGLLHLLRLKARYAEDYRLVVAALADRVAAALGQHLPDAAGFDATGRRQATPSLPPPSGQQTVSFVVAAAAADDLPGERTAREYYGSTPVDWSPYAPGRPGELASLLCDTAAELDLAPDVLALEESTVEQVGSGPRPEELVVLLVDAWAAKADRQQRLLTDLDAAVPEGTAVLEPRNQDDTQSWQHAEDLDAALDEVLPTLRGHASELERWGLRDEEKFTAALRKALVRAQNDAMKSAQVAQRLPTPTGGLDSFPLLGRSSS